MAAPDNNSIDVNGLIATAGAVFTLIASFLAILPLLRDRPVNITTPLDPLIKAIKIERHALDQKDWERIHSYLVLNNVLIFLVLLVEVGLIVATFVTPHNELAIPIITIITSVVYVVFALLVVELRPLFELRSRYAKDIRFDVFQRVEIYVEGDINYIYFKAQEALRGKRIQNVDADFHARKLETYLKGGLRRASLKITIVIETINENAKCHSLTINPEIIQEALSVNMLNFVLYFSLRSRKNNLIYIHAISAFINTFIGKLLTKQTSSGDAGKKA